jgi:hypothetical protein
MSRATATTTIAIAALVLGLAACTADTDDGGGGGGADAGAGGPGDSDGGIGGGDGDASPTGCDVPKFLDADGCDQVANFIDIAQSCGAGSQYADPEISGSCTSTTVEIRSNGIPNFDFVPITPNALQEQSFVFTFPRNPTQSNNPAGVPLGGASAVAVNGLPIFGPTEAPTHGYRDPVLDELLDYCNGHTAPGGVYHFHARPECLFSDGEGNTLLVVAYAFDGYPILAPYMCADAQCNNVTEVSSSYRQVESNYGDTIENAWDAHEYVNGLGDLDECNGMVLDDGSYAYFATATFPYFMGCYYGNATGGMSN